MSIVGLLLVGLAAAAVGQVSGESPHAESGQPRVLGAALELIGEGRYAQARELIEGCDARELDLAPAQFVLGLTYHGEDRAAMALACFERAVLRTPEVALYRLYQGLSLYKAGELGAAREVLTAYLEGHPQDSNAQVALGLIALDFDEVDVARGHLTRAVEHASTAGKQARARMHLADVLVRAGELRAAQAQLEQSVALDPGDSGAYHRLSRVLQRLGDAESAALAHENFLSRQGANGPQAVPAAGQTSGANTTLQPENRE